MNDVVGSLDGTQSSVAVDDEAGSHSRRKVPAFVLAILSGGILTLAYPQADLGFMAFFALVPFLQTFPYARTRAAFAYGYLFGFAYFAGLLYWIAVFAETKIGAFGVGAWFILSAREALYVGVFAAALNFFWTRVGWPGKVALAACLWAGIEWIRQLGALGFGWGDLAYSQWHFLPFIQIASVTGIWGVSWLIVLANAAVASRRPKIICATALLIVAVTITGAMRMRFEPTAEHLPAAAALQANISEDVPYNGLRPADSGYFYGTLDQFDRMAALAKSQGATICVTAETSVPGYPNLDPPLKAILSGIATRRDITLIVGARDVDARSQLDTNSVFVFHPDGTSTGPYNKQQLVPFGEYVPFRSSFPFLNNFHVLDFDMQAGASNQPPLDIGGRDKVGVAICYESTYPRFLRKQVARGATFIVVVTDDTWYGRTAAAKQHLAMSVLRAVESDRYLVRCASTGISAIISPTGKVLRSAGLYERSIVAAPIEQRFDLTPFVRFGDWFPILCLVVCALLVIRNRNRNDDAP